MNLFINTPSYYTQEHGVIDEIYDLCKKISSMIDVKRYTDCIDTIGIVPIIAPESVIEQGMFKEVKKISLPYRMAAVSLQIDYAKFCEANIDQKKELILDNIFCSLKVVEGKLKDKFNYAQLESDIVSCVMD